MTQMDKEYIEKEYEQAIKEYIAMQDYGFDYADELAMKKEDCKK